MVLTDKMKQYIRDHALEESPNECCGVIYLSEGAFEPECFKCSNIAEDPIKYFTINPKDYLRASLKGKVLAFYHSHSESDCFSDFDKINAENTYLTSFMYCIKTNTFHEYQPYGLEIPYTNRQYVLGFLDCFTLVQDFYQREKNIKISNLDHPYRFVDLKHAHPDNIKSHSILVDHFFANGFQKVKDLEKHDIILVNTNFIPSPVHAMIYLGEGQILHHPYKKPSIIEPYRNILKKWTTDILRHK